MPGNSRGACGVGTSDQITLTHSQAASLFWATRPTPSSFALHQMTRCQSRPGMQALASNIDSQPQNLALAEQHKYPFSRSSML